MKKRFSCMWLIPAAALAAAPASADALKFLWQSQMVSRSGAPEPQTLPAAPPAAERHTVQILPQEEDALMQIIQSLQWTPEENADGRILQPDAAPPAAYTPVLASSAAVIADAHSGQVLYRKNSRAVMPIASISKLMSAMVLLDGKQNMNQKLRITKDDIDTLKKSGSRLAVGTQLTRRQMLHLGLMSSENRAVHALARNYPGGIGAFVRAMNRKAAQLGMKNTEFHDPTGLDPRNTATAEDLVKLVQAAYRYPVIRDFSTAQSTQIKNTRGKTLRYKNSNALVREGLWDIGLQKTGYIRESGRCMVLHADVAERSLIIVLLDAPDSYARTDDALEVQFWVGSQL